MEALPCRHPASPSPAPTLELRSGSQATPAARGEHIALRVTRSPQPSSGGRSGFPPHSSTRTLPCLSVNAEGGGHTPKTRKASVWKLFSARDTRRATPGQQMAAHQALKCPQSGLVRGLQRVHRGLAPRHTGRLRRPCWLCLGRPAHRGYLLCAEHLLPRGSSQAALQPARPTLQAWPALCARHHGCQLRVTLPWWLLSVESGKMEERSQEPGPHQTA